MSTNQMRVKMVVAMVLATTGCASDPGGSGMGPDETGQEAALTCEGRAELDAACSHSFPFQVKLTFTQRVEHDTFNIPDETVTIYVQGDEAGTIRYIDSFSGGQRTYIQNVPEEKWNFRADGTSCTPAHNYMSGDGMNISTGFFAWCQGGGIGTNAGTLDPDTLPQTSYGGFDCLELPTDTGVERCFSTEHCVDVRQYVDSFGSRLEFQLTDVSYEPFDDAVFDHPCG